MRDSIERFGEVQKQAVGTPACLQRQGPIMCSLKKQMSGGMTFSETILMILK